MAVLTKATIWFNYRQALAQASTVEGIADDLKKLSNTDLEDALDTISANWTGENATLYRRKGETLQSNVLQSASELRSIAAEIRAIAARIYRAEMANLEIAQNRTY